MNGVPEDGVIHPVEDDEDGVGHSIRPLSSATIVIIWVILLMNAQHGARQQTTLKLRRKTCFLWRSLKIVAPKRIRSGF